MLSPTIRSRFLALICLTGLVLLVEHLIVTDAEAIEALGERAARAAADRDFGALGEVLADDFRYGSRDKASTLAYVQSLLGKHKPMGIEVTLFEIKVKDERATARGVVRAQVYGRPIGVGIDAELIETEEGWRLLRINSR